MLVKASKGVSPTKANFEKHDFSKTFTRGITSEEKMASKDFGVYEYFAMTATLH